MRGKRGRLTEALTGHFGDHHALVLARMLERVDQASADIATLDQRIAAEIAPFAPVVDQLDEITGSAASPRRS